MEEAKKDIIFITGASSGIGEAAAKLFSASGYALILVSRHLGKLENLGLPDCLCLQADVTKIDEMKEAVKIGQEHFGSIDCLINSAGVLTSKDFFEVTPQEHEEMIEVNFKGLVHCTQLILKGMCEKGRGTILNISSLGDRQPIAISAVYCATKAAVKSLSESLRKEYGPQGVRICNLAPAFIQTPIWERGRELYPKMWETMIQPEEFAKILLWLYQQPSHINISDLVVTPTRSPY